MFINNTYSCNFWTEILYKIKCGKFLESVGTCFLPPALSAGWTIIPFKAHSESCDDFSSHFGRISCAYNTFAQITVIN